MDCVAIPIPDLETQCKNLNLKTFQCGILQCSDHSGNPIDDPAAYALLLNNCTMVSHWFMTGEYNNDGIFHTHCMLLTTARNDSIKRSINSTTENLFQTTTWKRLWQADCTCDILKMQKCHKPQSMMEYCMKDPKWIMSNFKLYNEMAYSLDIWNFNERFKLKQEIQPTTQNTMTEDILRIIAEGCCKTFEDCIKTDPDTMAKYLHKPGFQSIVNTCLIFAKATGSDFKLDTFKKYKCDPTIIHTILLHQGIKPSDFDYDFYCWITKSHDKKNTFVLHGPSNTGKSQFIAHFKSIVAWGEICNGSSGFNFEQLIDQSFGIWEEPLINAELAEKCKQVFEGMPTAINVKYRKPHTLPRIPIFMTTNHDPWRFCTNEKDMFLNRMFMYQFNYTLSPPTFICRTSEHSCECSSCKTSSGRSLSSSSTSTSGLQTTNESIPSSEQSFRSSTDSIFSTGSLSRARSRSPICSSELSTNLECSSTTSTRSCSSTTTIGINNSNSTRSDNSRIGIHQPLTISRKCMEPNRHREYNDSYSRRTSDQQHRSQFSRRRIGRTVVPTTSSHSLDSLQLSEKEKTLSISSKQSRLDREVDPIILTTVQIPTPTDWKNYLCYLLCKYG